MQTPPLTFFPLFGGNSMVFGLFKRKDPVCGMKEEKGKGIEKEGKWFCADACAKKYSEGQKKSGSCCGH